MHCWFVQVGRGCGVCALGFPFLRTLCVCGARFLSLTSYICHCCMAVFVPVALPFGRSGRVLHADTYGRGKVSIGSFCNAYFCTAVHPFNAHRCCVQLSLVYVQTCREHDDLPLYSPRHGARSLRSCSWKGGEYCVSYAPAGRRVVVCAMSTAVGIDRLRMCLLRAYGCCRGDDSEASAGHPICLLHREMKSRPLDVGTSATWWFAPLCR